MVFFESEAEQRGNMEDFEITQKMCREELSQADIKAICGARGFSLSEAGIPEILENFIMSDIGLEKAFAGLGRKEIIALHLMKYLNKPMDVSVLRGLAVGPDKYGTFNQRFTPTFKYVRQKIVRRGLMAFCDHKTSYERMTKLERLRFVFPSAFHSHLPGPFVSPVKIKDGGESNERLIREKLYEILTPVSEKDLHIDSLNLHDGRLQIGRSEFTTDLFMKHRLRDWAASFSPSLEGTGWGDAVSPLSALNHAFSLLEPDEWIEPDELNLFLNVFCSNWEGAGVGMAEICERGWEKGILLRCKSRGQYLYRPFRAHLEIDLNFESYLDKASADYVRLNLETVSVKSLERISEMAFFKANDGVLQITPDPVRMGRNLEMTRKDPILSWLIKKSNIFAQVFQTLEKRWGKQIVHDNLLIAQVKQVGLKAALEKSFPDGRMMFLPDDFIAFPKDLLGPVESMVVRNGFAVKTIEHRPDKGAESL